MPSNLVKELREKSKKRKELLKHSLGMVLNIFSMQKNSKKIETTSMIAKPKNEREVYHLKI